MITALDKQWFIVTEFERKAKQESYRHWLRTGEKCDNSIEKLRFAFHYKYQLFLKDFDPSQPRDELGRWTDGGAGGIAGEGDLNSLLQGDVYEGAGERFIDLLSDEGKGHTISKHVGKTDFELTDRLSKMEYPGLFVTVKEKYTSSFDSLTGAQDYINDAISKPENSILIDNFVNSNASKIEFETDLGYFTGRQAYRNADNEIIRVRDVTGIRVVLIRDKNRPNGFYILTSYPIYK